MAYADKGEVIIPVETYAALMRLAGIAEAVCPRLTGSDKATLAMVLGTLSLDNLPAVEE